MISLLNLTEYYVFLERQSCEPQKPLVMVEKGLTL